MYEIVNLPPLTGERFKKDMTKTYGKIWESVMRMEIGQSIIVDNKMAMEQSYSVAKRQGKKVRSCKLKDNQWQICRVE